MTAPGPPARVRSLLGESGADTMLGMDENATAEIDVPREPL